MEAPKPWTPPAPPSKRITVYCERCESYSREYSFAPEHRSPRRRCPRPGPKVLGSVKETIKVCGGELSIRDTGRGRWSKRFIR